MIQRVQTIWLLLAAGLMTCVFFLPLGTLFGHGEQVVLRAREWWPMAVLTGLAALLLIVTIFTYKRRWLQLRLCFSATVMTLGTQGFAAFYVLRMGGIEDVVSWKFGVAAIFPLVAFVLVLLAIRGVVRDDRLVKSLDRLR